MLSDIVKNVDARHWNDAIHMEGVVQGAYRTFANELSDRYKTLDSSATIFAIPSQGISRKERITPSEIEASLATGCTIYALDVGSWFPELMNEVNEINQHYALGYPRISLFAGFGGAGLPLHWDNMINFTLQLAGKKHWRIAPNTSVADPTENYSVKDGRYGPTNERYEPDPSAIREVDLNAGDAIFIPRGYWHGTSVSTGYSVSLSVNFKPLLVADYIAHFAAKNSGEFPGLRREIRSLTEAERAALSASLRGSFAEVDRHRL